MDTMWVVGVALGVLNLVTIAFAKVLSRNFEDVKKTADNTTKELSEFKLEVAKNYVANHELTQAIEALAKNLEMFRSMLERIERKLDDKLDRDIYYNQGNK